MCFCMLNMVVLLKEVKLSNGKILIFPKIMFSSLKYQKLTLLNIYTFFFF